MSISDLPVWDECPFDVSGVTVRRGEVPDVSTGEPTEVVVFEAEDKGKYVTLKSEFFSPVNVGVALDALHSAWCPQMFHGLVCRNYERRVRIS